MANRDSLVKVAGLLQRRNEVDAELASVIRRPPTTGHLGEWVASEVFDIQLNPSASHPSIDGVFRFGPLAGKTVDIKLHTKQAAALARVCWTLLLWTGPAGR